VLRADTEDIIVGERCNIQDLCCLHADPGEPAILGNGVSLGHKAMVHGAVVEDGALIGINAVVLGGATVEAGALVAAGALVPPGRRVPAGTLWAGVPGKVIRELTDAERENLVGTAERSVGYAAQHRGVTWR
jgi:carbonic anhydrase/acetyltransferase-like protein (isoleucine patch superfamily)